MSIRGWISRATRSWWWIALPLMMLGGCTTPAPRLIVDHCTGWRPIYPGGDDVLTRGTADQILAHDRHGAAMGCWEAPGKPSSPTADARPR